MSFQLGLTFFGGEESRFIVSSRTFTALRRYREYLATAAESDGSPADGCHSLDASSSKEDPLDHFVREAGVSVPTGRYSGSAEEAPPIDQAEKGAVHDGSDNKDDDTATDHALTEVAGTNDDELTVRLRQFDERTVSLRSERTFIENVYLYRAYADRAKDLMGAFASGKAAALATNRATVSSKHNGRVVDRTLAIQSKLSHIHVLASIPPSDLPIDGCHQVDMAQDLGNDVALQCGRNPLVSIRTGILGMSQTRRQRLGHRKRVPQHVVSSASMEKT